jgi:S1-C subfamily serine protease
MFYRPSADAYLELHPVMAETRPCLGVQVVDGVIDRGQVEVIEVLSDTARQAGLRPGDLVIAVNGTPLSASTQAMIAEVQKHGERYGTSVPAKVELRRGGVRVDVAVPVVGEAPASGASGTRP